MTCSRVLSSHSVDLLQLIHLRLPDDCESFRQLTYEVKKTVTNQESTPFMANLAPQFSCRLLLWAVHPLRSPGCHCRKFMLQPAKVCPTATKTISNTLAFLVPCGLQKAIEAQRYLNWSSWRTCSKITTCTLYHYLSQIAQFCCQHYGTAVCMKAHGKWLLRIA